MRDQDKTKEELIVELKELRQTLNRFKQAEMQRRIPFSTVREAFERARGFESAAEIGVWSWDSSSDEAIFYGSATRSDRPFSENMEAQYDGKWNEIVHSEDLGEVINAIDSWRKGIPGPVFSFRPKEAIHPETVIMALCCKIERIPAEELTIAWGAYWDATAWMQLFRRLKELGQKEILQAVLNVFNMGLGPLSRSSRLLTEYMLKSSDLISERLFYPLMAYLWQVPLFLKDSKQRYIYVNSAAERSFGIPASEINGKTDAQLFGEDSDGRLEFEYIEAFGVTALSKTVHLTGKTSKLLLIMHASTHSTGGRTQYLGTIAPQILDTSVDSSSASRSPAMRKVNKRARVAAKTESIILITGETGSGKGRLAKYIHEHSNRSSGPFKRLSCADLPEQLAESELFGHERGAFTGATARKQGLLELAEGGTLLLDEIGELSPKLQTKLLTFLETRSFTRLGGTKEITVNARLIAATNRNLEKDVSDKKFRQDLFYRLNVIRINVPSLKDRKEDLPILIRDIIAELQTKLGISDPVCLPPQFFELIANHPLRGNVRELRNLIERQLVLSGSEGVILSTEDFEDEKHTNVRDQSLEEPSLAPPTSSNDAEVAAIIVMLKRKYNGKVLRPALEDITLIYQTFRVDRRWSYKEIGNALGGVDASAVYGWFKRNRLLPPKKDQS
jgi:transcriptional regulator with PAS, ATPase and Fis domain